MPANSVYQPTTVSFEGSSGGYLAQQTSNSRLKFLRNSKKIQYLVAIFGLCFIVFGVILITIGSVDYEDTEVHKEEIGPEFTNREEESDLVVIIIGSFLLLVGFVLLGLYIKVAEWRRSCVCPCKSLAKKQQQQQILALNPSTDPLVTHTQYAPVSEIPRVEDEERRNLMPDNKDCMSSAEESDRMLDSNDPRIVLRPRQEDA